MKQTLAGILIVVAGVFILSAPPVLAGPWDGVFCEGDFTYDGDVDADDVTEFLVHFGREPGFRPCPPDGPAPVGWSGQMTSYATGDDGDLEKGVHWVIPRFLDNGDGTATDKLTGLIWLKNANCFGLRTWYSALSDSNGLENGECGLTDGSSPGDWRLPSITELRSVVDYSQYNPAIGFFALLVLQNVQSYYYWSSTTSANGTSYAWDVNVNDGYVLYNYKTYNFYVWPVRGGQ